MIETIKNAFKIKEIRRKIFMTFLLVLIYRLGCFIPVPGISASVFESTVQGNDFFSIMSAITGGALSQGTLLAIGISPYINAQIIMQLLTVAIPSLERLSKEGEEGKKKINRITRWMTLGIAILNAVGILFAFNTEGMFNTTMFGAEFVLPVWVLFVFVTIIFVAGSMLTMWLGERITEYGVSNGISILIFVGIVATAGQAIVNNVSAIITNGFVSGGGWNLLLFVIILLVVFSFIIFVDGAERKIKVQYAKQVKGNKMYGGQSTFIPIKVNGGGVLPLIFAFSLLSLPQMIFSFFGTDSGVYVWWTTNMTASGGTWWGTVLYLVSMTAWIFIFAFFYSQIQFNPIEISKNIQQNGGFLPGIRPGRETSDYLAKTIMRITFWGALFLAIMALLPSTVFQLVGNSALTNAYSASGLLIVVSVALEFDKALQNQIMMRHYKGFLR